ncbi:FecR family protein [Chitinophaga arvensicola]|uniref:FecR protein n=1 Tax=Chitinophaga arvensicola TaxID=29529 RepID=A0A1I0SAR0_9BACT|nr:FecR domain-containing protein [Chitinophaga arvensicola]SEW53466.1 FecR protein [Chitinophaga arvensicola]
MSIQDRLSYLLRQALNYSATDAELQELSNLVRDDQAGDITRQLEQLLQEEIPAAPSDAYDSVYWDNIAGKILASDHLPETNQAPVVRLGRLRWLSAAAAALLLLLAGAYWLLRPAAHAPEMATTAPLLKNDIAPGGNKAILTLADGTQVPLDSSGDGTLTRQGNTRISRPAGGQLMYTPLAEDHAVTTSYNTLRTPKGGQFQVTLPDGTKVWLNAASALKYPVAFNGRSRQVELTGEAYFEVVQRADMPFKVNVHTGTDQLEVTVLGTQFNIMAYEDETAINTTLLQGAVKVSHGNTSKQLAPGQGAYLNRQDHLLSVLPQVNTEEAVAWKNGYLQLEGNDITSAMRLIARWYDMEVVYKAPVTAHFRGIIPRNVPVSQVLKMMEMTGEVHFDIRGKQIIVSP